MRRFSYNKISILLFLMGPVFSLAASPGVLSDYSQIDEVIGLPEIGGNLSGVTYNYDTGTYFMIQNNGGKIFEYDRGLRRQLRLIHMTHLSDLDTEDIVYLGHNRFALSSEKNHVLIFTLTPGQTTVDLGSGREDVQDFTFPPPAKVNNGLEGVCYSQNSSSGRGTFYAVQEKLPERVFSFVWPDSDKDFHQPKDFGLNEYRDIAKILNGRMNDLSGCTFDPESNHLLLLSHESSRVMELTPAGDLIQTLNIPPAAKQYEGITFGPDRELVLVSEPNTVVVMKKHRP